MSFAQWFRAVSPALLFGHTMLAIGLCDTLDLPPSWAYFALGMQAYHTLATWAGVLAPRRDP